MAASATCALCLHIKTAPVTLDEMVSVGLLEMGGAYPCPPPIKSEITRAAGRMVDARPARGSVRGSPEARSS